VKDTTAPTTAWQKSSFSSDEGSCVELATIDHSSLAIRESDYPDTVLTTTPHRLRALLHSVRTGTLNRP
jgi:hypothetical protein